VSRRWAVCRVCGAAFAPRTARQDVCQIACLYRDPRHRLGYPMKAMQAALKRERAATHSRAPCWGGAAIRCPADVARPT
jgi:hypothetical protein